MLTTLNSTQIRPQASFKPALSKNEVAPESVDSPDFYADTHYDDAFWTNLDSAKGSHLGHNNVRFMAESDGPQRLSYTKFIEDPSKPLSLSQRIGNGISAGAKVLIDELGFGAGIIAFGGLMIGAAAGPLAGIGCAVGLTAVSSGYTVREAKRNFNHKTERQAVTVSGTAAMNEKQEFLFRPDGLGTTVNLGDQEALYDRSPDLCNYVRD